ncbi:sensor histidine kinase [Kitasatospora sp. NPDC001175]|uniref:sensor histidine kinase n=1 Tax=Kitasatospora sp. NPDC001175 TaxID=3157103 RepID=UPI003CFE8663
MDGETGWRTAGAVLSVVAAAVLVPGVVMAGRSGRPRPVVVARAAGPVSLALTVLGWAVGPYPESDRLLGLAGVAELLALLGLVTVTLRAGRDWFPVALVGAAVVGWPLRYVRLPQSPLELAESLVFGAGTVLLAALLGLYLGVQDEHRRREVAAARRTQRLELAHDLHDFVAHDVSAMVALAQAGAIVATVDPERAAEVFRRIEQSGQQALTSLDRTVHLLRTKEEGVAAARTPQPGLAELPELVERFAAVEPVEVSLELPAEPVGREAAATAYRVVVEALTNVRRHAPRARSVEVEVRRAGGRLEVRVTSDGSAGERTTRHGGGHGLAQLAERCEALGGSFTAGRHGGNGWRVSALIPAGAPAQKSASVSESAPTAKSALVSESAPVPAADGEVR